MSASRIPMIPLVTAAMGLGPSLGHIGTHFHPSLDGFGSVVQGISFIQSKKPRIKEAHQPFEFQHLLMLENIEFDSFIMSPITVSLQDVSLDTVTHYLHT